MKRSIVALILLWSSLALASGMGGGIDFTGQGTVKMDAVAIGTTLLKDYAPNPKLPTGINLFGDSVTLGGALIDSLGGANVFPLTFSSSVNAGLVDTNGWFWHVEDALGWPWPVTQVVNNGIGGNTTTQMRARFQTDVLSNLHQFVSVNGGTNDPTNGITAVTTIANLQWMYDQIRSAGARLIISTPPANSSITTAKGILDYGSICTFIKNYAALHPDVIYADMAASNRTSMANPTPVSGTISSNPHPNEYGGALWGQVLANVLLGTPGLPSPATLITANTGQGNLITNGLMTGTGGGPSQRASGTMADSWYVGGNGTDVSGAGTGPTATSASAVASKVARTDGLPGEWQQVVHSGMTPGPQDGNANTRVYQFIDAGFTPGQTVSGYVEWQADADWNVMDKFFAVIIFQGSSGPKNVYSLEPGLGFTPAYAVKTNLISGVMCIPPTTIPAGTTELRFYVKFYGDAGTYRIGRCQLMVQ